jgi:hypothetical protein
MEMLTRTKKIFYATVEFTGEIDIKYLEEDQLVSACFKLHTFVDFQWIFKHFKRILRNAAGTYRLIILDHP